MRLLFLCVMLSLGVAPVLSAQVAVDVAAGVGRGLGGPGAHNRNQMALSGTVALPVRAASHGSWTIALSSAIDVGMGGTGCLAGEESTCRQFPSFLSVSALVGWSQHASFSHGVRLMGGPAYVRMDGPNTNEMGLVLKADAASRINNHLSLISGVQGILTPRWLGENIGVASLHLGLRIH